MLMFCSVKVHRELVQVARDKVLTTAALRAPRWFGQWNTDDGKWGQTVFQHSLLIYYDIAISRSHHRSDCTMYAIVASVHIYRSFRTV